MRLKYLAIVALLGIVPLGIGAAATAAYAQGELPSQICNVSNPEEGITSECFNVDGGDYSQGTSIIGYTYNNDNNYFEFNKLGIMCGNGVVVDGAKGVACPFTYGSGLNAALAGDTIISVKQPNPSGLCAGTPTSTSYYLELLACPSSAGTGGAWSSIDVAVPVVLSANTVAEVLINVRWADNNYADDPGCASQGNGWGCAANLIADGKGNPIFIGDDLNVEAGDPYGASAASLWLNE